MESREVVATGEEVKEESDYSCVRALVDLFVAPSKTFLSIAKRPRWLVPLLICIAVGLFAEASTNQYGMKEIEENLRTNKYLSKEEAERRIENIRRQEAEGPTFQQIAVGVTLVGAIEGIEILFVAFVIWLGLQVSSTKVSFGPVFSVCCFAFLIEIPEFIVKTPLIVAKGTTKVYLGLAALAPVEWAGSPLFNVLEKLDIFSIWLVALLMLGLPLATGVSKKLAITTVSYLWGVWLLFSMYFGSLMRVT